MYHAARRRIVDGVQDFLEGRFSVVSRRRALGMDGQMRPIGADIYVERAQADGRGPLDECARFQVRIVVGGGDDEVAPEEWGLHDGATPGAAYLGCG